MTIHRTEARRLAIAAIGALVVSTACIAGAVAPAWAAGPDTQILRPVQVLDHGTRHAVSWLSTNRPTQRLTFPHFV